MDNEKWHQYLSSARWSGSLAQRKPLLMLEVEKAVNNIPDIYKDRRVLMLGCGNGYELEILRRRGFTNFVGLTYTEVEIERAFDKIRDKIVLGDMHELPFKDNQFDFIYSKETLEHCLCPYIVLCELNRVLKMDARFLHYIAEGEVKQSDIFHYACFPPYMWIDYFHKTGFKTDKVLTSKDNTNSYDIQSAHYGKKIEHKSLTKKITPYFLPDITKNVEKGELDLLCKLE